MASPKRTPTDRMALELANEPKFSLRTSYRIGVISKDLELWQVGEDRLDEFSDLVYKTYGDFCERHGATISREEIHATHIHWLKRTTFLATIGPGGMNGSGAGIQLYDGADYFLPDEFENAVDYDSIRKQYGAREIWAGTRNSVESSYFNSPGRALKAMKSIIDIGYGNILRWPDCLIFAIVADNIFQRWRRMGYNWTIVPGPKLPHPVIDGILLNPIILETNNPWTK